MYEDFAFVAHQLQSLDYLNILTNHLVSGPQPIYLATLSVEYKRYKDTLTLHLIVDLAPKYLHSGVTILATPRNFLHFRAAV